MWTPIVKRYATLNELKNVYTFEDVLDMHEVIITLAKEVVKPRNPGDFDDVDDFVFFCHDAGGKECNR